MSNKKTIPTISSSEASKMSVSALAVRPNDASRFGQGGLSAKALQEWFDKLPNLVKEKFNEIAQTLASAEAAKYIGTDALGVDNLYDFLLLFGPRGTGLNDKNISDHIETLYTPEHSDTDDDPTASMTLKDIIADITARIVENTRVSRDAINYVDVTINEYGDLVTDYYTEGYGGNFVVHEFVLLSKNIGDGTITTEKLDQALNERIKAAIKDVSYIASNGQLVFKREAGGNIVVDLPLELIVTSGRFDTNKNEIVLVLANGNEIRIPLDAVIGKITSDIEALKDSVKTVRLEGDRLVFESHRGARNDIDLSSFAFDTASREKLDDLGRRVTNIEEHISDDYFVTDEAVAYEKAVPARACSSAKLASFGGMTHKSENLIKFPYAQGSNARFTILDDGAISIHGSGNDFFSINDKSVELKGGTTYTLSGVDASGGYSSYYLYVTEADGTNHFDIGNGITFTAKEDGLASVSLVINSGETQVSVIVKPMLNEGSSALPYEPYYEGLRDSKVTEIKSHGANFIPILPWANKTVNGVTFALDNDGVYHLSGTAIETMAENFHMNLPAGSKYTVTLNNNKTFGASFGVYLAAINASGDWVLVHSSHFPYSNQTQNITDDIVGVQFAIVEGTNCDGLTIAPMLNEGDYIPYKPHREPISYPIPAAIQAINGYGKDGFVIDLEKQTSAYEGRVSPLPVRLEPIIKVEGGGRLEFVNEYKNAVPSTVKYLLKEESAV